MEHFKKFDAIALDAIRETFLAEGFSKDSVNDYIEKCGSIEYTKTHDRRVLGQLNDFHISISWQIEDYLPSENINLVELNKWVNNNLMCGSLNYANPIELLREELE